VPAHFTTPTGKDHWHVLMRARAIENQLYVVAAAQIGETLPGKPAYGRSLIVDPWGVVVAQAPDEQTVIAAELDRAHLQNIRAKLPSLANRQPNAYRWPTRV
jgi:predicted amidohydrolase